MTETNRILKCLEDIGVENALRTVEEKEAIQATKHQYKLFIYEDLTRDMKVCLVWMIACEILIALYTAKA